MTILIVIIIIIISIISIITDFLIFEKKDNDN